MIASTGLPCRPIKSARACSGCGSRKRRATSQTRTRCKRRSQNVSHLIPLQGAAFHGPWQETWRRALGTLQETNSAEAQRRVYWLASYGASSGEMSPEHSRAILETAFELLSDAGHRHILRCALAGGAARSGDVVAAETWLAGCDPAPANLTMDSAYRMTRAFVLTLQRDATRVLQIVAANVRDLPLDPARELGIGLFRAHALETLGRQQEADEQLAFWIQRDEETARRLFAAPTYAPLLPLTRSRVHLPG